MGEDLENLELLRAYGKPGFGNSKRLENNGNMAEKPLLSICIPTYNRAGYLDACLKAIVSQDGFEEIEVVISDNHSSDDTESVGKEYQSRYSNIHYFRNNENVVDMNYPLVFQRATGCLRKLTNDTVHYKPGAVRYMLNAAKENMGEKPQVYFLSKGGFPDDGRTVRTLDDYLNALGHYLTWVRSVAVWDIDCEDLGTLVTKADSRMAQVPFLLENFEKRGGAVLYDREIMGAIDVQRKDLSYGLYKVFYETFLGFIKPYVDRGKVSSGTYDNLRKDLLLNFFCEWIVNRELDTDKYIFAGEDLQKLVEDAYKDEPYFKDYRRMLRRLRIIGRIRKIVRTIC